MQNRDKESYTFEKALQKLKWQYLFNTALEAVLNFVIFWYFISGVLVLIFRQIGKSLSLFNYWILGGVAVGLLYVVFFSTKRMLDEKVFVATLDAENKAGGLLIAEAELDDSSWNNQNAKRFSVPVIKIDYSKKYVTCIVALLFSMTCFYVPVVNYKINEKKIDFTNKIAELDEQIRFLEKEGIITAEEKSVLEESIKRIDENSDKNAPGVSFEALDQLEDKLLKEASNDLKKRITDRELLNKLKSYAERAKAEEINREKSNEMLTQMMNMLRKEGLTEEQIGDLLKKTFGNQIMDKGFSPENVQNSAERLGEESMKQLNDIARLSEEMLRQKLISPALAQQIQNEAEKSRSKSKNNAIGENQENNLIIIPKNGQTGDVDEGKSGISDNSGKRDINEDSLKGNEKGQGVGQKTESGNVYTPMTFGDKTSDYNAKFKDQVLPEAKVESSVDTKVIGIGISSPENIKEIQKNESLEMEKRKNGNDNNSKTVLPKYRNAVKNYFSN